MNRYFRSDVLNMLIVFLIQLVDLTEHPRPLSREEPGGFEDVHCSWKDYFRRYQASEEHSSCEAARRAKSHVI